MNGSAQWWSTPPETREVVVVRQPEEVQSFHITDGEVVLLVTIVVLLIVIFTMRRLASSYIGDQKTHIMELQSELQTTRESLRLSRAVNDLQQRPGNPGEGEIMLVTRTQRKIYGLNDS